MQDLQYYSEVDVQQLESLISLDDLLQVIGYQVDKIQRGADKWKCFCPIHKETIFRSLTIQVGRRTFRCGFLQCKGHRGGSLLDLYRLALDKDEIETIDFWSKRLKFPIKRKDEAEDETVEAAPDEIPTEEIGVEYDDEDFLQDLVETDVETVSTISSVTQQQESLSDDYDFDLDTVDFDLTPTTEEPAEIVEEEALEVEQEIEQEVVEEPVPVETVVEPVIAKPKTADQYLFDIGQMLAEDRRDEADSLLNDALEQFPQHPELLHARVRYYESGGLTAQAIEVLEELLEIYRQRHLPDGCLRAAHQILVLDPDSLSAFDTIIEAHLQRHESNLAVRFLQDAIRLCLEGNEPNQALQRVEKLREICIPGSPEESRALEQEIHILEMLGRIEDVVALRLELAKLYIRKELVGKAGDILEKIIESAPQCREAYQLLVDLYLARGMQQQAIAQMQRLAEQYLSPAPDGSEEAAAKGMEQAIATYMHILELEPGQTETRNRLALLYKHSGAMDKAAEQYFTIAQTYRDKELLGRAIRIYENLIQQKIEVPRATQTLVDVLLEKGDETSAVRRLTDLAQTFLQEENFAEAETSLKKAAALQPGQESLQRQLVELYRKTNQKGPRLETYRQLLKIVDQQGDEEKLKQLCEEIIEIDPQNPDAALRLKRMEETAQEAEPAEKEPGSIHAMLARAESLKSEGEHTQAIEILKSALLVETGNEQIWRNLADAYFQAGQMEQSAETLIRHTDWLDSEGRSDDALKLLSAASERLPRFPMPNRLALLRIRSQLQLKTNKQDKAFTTCTEIVDLSKNNPEDWLNLARLADEQQREEQALQSFQQAAELFANNRQWPASAQCLRRILELTPEDTEVRIRLSELLQKQGESAEAIRQRLQATTILAASQSIEKALAALEPVLDLHPPHLQALEQWFSLVQQSPDDLATQVDRAINLAEVYKTQGLVGKAGQHLETLRQLLPEEKKVLRAQIDLYRETGTPQKL